MINLEAIKARLGSLSPRRLEEIYKVSPAAFRLLSVDFHEVLRENRIVKENNCSLHLGVGCQCFQGADRAVGALV